MVCGQIHAPATLPNYVHMHVMNSSLWPPCNLRNLVCLFLFNFLLKKPLAVLSSSFKHLVNTFQCEASFTLLSVAVTGRHL